MKLHDRPRVELLYTCDNLIIPILKAQISDISEFIKKAEQLDITKDYTIKIEEIRKKRSLDANGYFWVLVGKLAEKLCKGNIEVYRQLVYDNGSFDVVCVKQEAVDSIKKKWESNGDGWIAVDIGEAKRTPNSRVLKLYAGTSTYDTKQMSRLIDATIQECKEQGIETLTPREINILKENWKNE